MIASVREKYNAVFTTEKYRAFLADMDNQYNKKVEFRIAESPVFVDKALKSRVLQACDEIMKIVLGNDYLMQTNRAIPPDQFVPNETRQPLFLAFDFAVCHDENREFIPKLIELQAFPSLFFWQDLVARKYRSTFIFLIILITFSVTGIQIPIMI